MEAEALLWSVISIIISFTQFVYVVWILFSLRKVREQNRQAPGPPQAKSVMSRLSVIPTFNPSVNASWRSNLRRRTEATETDDPEGVEVESKNDVLENSEADFEPLPDVSVARPILASEMSKLEAAAGPGRISADNLVLPIYYRFLWLQAFHCFLWAFVCLVLVFWGDNLVEWGQSDASPASFGYYMGTGLLMGVGGALLDGVLIFLCQDSVGRKSISRSYKFACGWGLVNAFASTITAAYGRSSERNKPGPGPGPLPPPDPTQSPWWDPFFIRTMLMLAFNGSLLLVCLCLTWKEQWKRRPRTNPYAVQPAGDEEYANIEGGTEEAEEENKHAPRTAWVKLALFNFCGAGVLALLYLIDFAMVGKTTETSQWATAHVLGFLIFFLAYTPVLCWTLERDSFYWRESWLGALTSITPKTRLMDGTTTDTSGAVDANIVIDFGAIHYLQVLGRGGFSTVYRGTVWDSIQLPVAIKVLHVEEMTKEVVERFLEEVRIFVRFRHPNVVHFVGACISPPDFAIVMELCRRESLADSLKQHNERVHELFTERLRRLKLTRSQQLFTDRGHQEEYIQIEGRERYKNPYYHNKQGEQRKEEEKKSRPAEGRRHDRRNSAGATVGLVDAQSADDSEVVIRTRPRNKSAADEQPKKMRERQRSAFADFQSEHETETFHAAAMAGGGILKTSKSGGLRVASPEQRVKVRRNSMPIVDTEGLSARSPAEAIDLDGDDGDDDLLTDTPTAVTTDMTADSPTSGIKAESKQLRDSRRRAAHAPRKNSEELEFGYPKLYPAERVIEIAIAIADAMRYMHSMDVLHRDLKSSNILFDTHNNPKICDFGLSRENSQVTEHNSFVGTIAYMSPEVLRFEKVTKKSDVYSFGVIFWELLTGKLAWTKYYYPEKGQSTKGPIAKPRPINPFTIMERVSRHKARPPIRKQDNIHPVLHVLVRECWADDQDCRPSFAEIVKRLDTFEKSHHFQSFKRQAGVFGETMSTKWLKGKLR